jgi:hypothetical protein
MKTTPTEALEVALCHTAVDLSAVEAAGLTACRLKCQGEWRDTGLGTLSSIFFGNTLS